MIKFKIVDLGWARQCISLRQHEEVFIFGTNFGNMINYNPSKGAEYKMKLFWLGELLCD